MATSDSALERLLARASRPLPDVTWSDAGDLGRMSVEAMVAQSSDLRELTSVGALRLHGAGVEGHAAPLSSVGQIASSWQRAVSAVGAALEGAKSNRGRLADVILQRTALMLAAAPAPGSLVLQVTPRSDPFIEVAPDGTPPLVDPERPLADRASETLIELLGHAVDAGPDAEDLADSMRELGARVAANIKELSRMLELANFDLDASWREPGRPSVRVRFPSGTAKWLADFVDGKALDSYEDEVVGVTRTISDVARWRIETTDGTRFVDASELSPTARATPHLGETVRLAVRVHPVIRPDGTSSESLVATELLPVDPEADNA